MTERTSPDRQAIHRAVERINGLWLAGRYDDIGELVTDDAVIAPPGSHQRVTGRKAYVQSYRDYDRACTTRDFVPSDLQVDVVGDVAVAVCPFVIEYEMEGEVHREKGHDFLVFTRVEGEWRVAWRTMQTGPAE
jgi:ketosteroid isomerase-like protein